MTEKNTDVEFGSIFEPERLKGIVDRLDDYHQKQRLLLLEALVKTAEKDREWNPVE